MDDHLHFPSVPLAGAARGTDGKVALVIGASRGIGAVTAKTLADAGCTVVLAARSETALDQLAAEIEAAGGEALAVPTDAADPQQIAALIDRVVAGYGRLDIAINNAASNHPPKPVAQVTLDEFDDVIAVNLRGLFVALAAEIRAMLDSGGGAIVNIASTAGLRGVPNLAGYAATKHATVGLTKVAALDYATSGIRVNAVAPGPIATHRLADLPDDVRDRVAQAVPMRRLGDPGEVADLVAWLTSDQASFITGTVIAIDGGRSAGLG